jgi:hypothetical protein
MASPVTFPLGPGQGTDNLTALASGQARGLGVIGTNQVLVSDIVIAPIQIETGASAAGTVELRLIVSEDNSHWTDGISPVSTSDQSSLIKTAPQPVSPINVEAAATQYWFPGFSVLAVLGYIPMFSAVVVWNRSGSSFNATASNFYAQYSTILYQTPVPLIYG